jgi:serine/threonine protein kinase
MEFARFGQLREAKKQSRISIAGTLTIARQCLSGLAYLYERRIMHRDIKPANIMVFSRTQFLLSLQILVSPKLRR